MIQRKCARWRFGTLRTSFPSFQIGRQPDVYWNATLRGRSPDVSVTSTRA